MFSKRKILALILVVCMIVSVFAFVSCSKKEEKSTEQSDRKTETTTERHILDIKIINGDLWVLYSDKPEEPVKFGRVENVHDGTQGLEFFPLPDGTYGVKGGSTYYLEEIVIPAYYNGVNVTRILDEAFSGYVNLTKVTIPDTVTHIDSNAFNACVKLETVTLPQSITHIGNGALGNCSALKSVLIGDAVEYIGEFAFMNDLSMLTVTIPASVKSIGRDAFKNCGEGTCAIYCAVSEKPSSWDELWNSSSLPVYWGE